MVTMDQVKRGLARYVDEEFTSKINGWQKWAVGAGAAMALENMESTAAALRENPAVQAMGIFDAAGNVDMDRLYTFLKAQAQKSPVTTRIPIVGNVTLNETDVDKLYALISQS